MFVVGAGLSTLETGADNFLAICGPPRYSEIRLNLAQGIQGVGKYHRHSYAWYSCLTLPRYLRRSSSCLQGLLRKDCRHSRGPQECPMGLPWCCMLRRTAHYPLLAGTNARSHRCRHARPGRQYGDESRSRSVQEADQSLLGHLEPGRSSDLHNQNQSNDSYSSATLVLKLRLLIISSTYVRKLDTAPLLHPIFWLSHRVSILSIVSWPPSS